MARILRVKTKVGKKEQWKGRSKKREERLERNSGEGNRGGLPGMSDILH